MPRVVCKNGRVAVLNGRLVTDAGGAPCCCSEVPCPCDLTNPTTRDRWACGPFRTVEILGGALFGTITMRVRWSSVSEWASANGAFFERITSEGYGILCTYSDGLPPAPVAGSFSRSSFASSFVDGGTPRTFEGGPDQWGHGYTRFGTVAPVVGVTGALLSRASHQWSGGVTSALPQLLLDEQCVLAESPPGAGFSRSLNFADADEGGVADGTRDTFAPQGPGTSQIAVEWTRSLNCRVSGEGLFSPGTAAALAAAGIDPVTLRPFTPGCPGCG